MERLIDPKHLSDVEAIARIASVQNILEVVCRSTGMGFSAVARVTDAQWIACAVRDEISFGLKPGGELKLETTLCDEIRQSGKLVVIDDVATDAAYCNHHTPAQYGFKSYISVPITLADGRFFGTLCAIDPKPAKLKTPETIGMFKLFAELIAQHLNARDEVVMAEKALTSERETALFREQFIAVLGHDLRNPLAAIKTGVMLLTRQPQHDEDTRNILGIIHRSAARIEGLIDNVLDFAQGRLGGGLAIRKADRADLEPVLNQVVRELQTAWSTRTIQSEWVLDRAMSCDTARIAQMFSNLLANALTHGDPAGPVWVRAMTTENELELSVANLGTPIPPEILGKLFQPFRRGTDRSAHQGLGLGLFIASEIARAHGGTIDVQSTAEKTRFAFRMPLSV